MSINEQTHSLKWATDWLISHGYVIDGLSKQVVASPWSAVWSIKTTTGDFYVKQTPPLLSLEAKIIDVLSKQCHANVAQVLAVNDDFHCFLMKDAGKTLRETLKSELQVELLLKAIDGFSAMQKTAEKHLESFLALGIPDWRLDKLPGHYESIINQTDLLISEGMTHNEIKRLHELMPQLTDQCEQLSRYHIPETIVQPDFNTNNVLIDPATQKLTFIDLGELAISHPYFSLHNFIYQAMKHHGVKLEPFIQPVHREAFLLSKKLWSIYGVLAYERLRQSVDAQALKNFYADRPSPIATDFRNYMMRSL